MWSSPLILGFNIADPNKSWATEMLKNKALLEIDQDPLAIAARRVMNHTTPCAENSTECKNVEVWVKPLVRDRVAVALVNMASIYNQTDVRYGTEQITVSWSTIGLPHGQACTVYSATDLKNLGEKIGSIGMEVEPHGIAVFVLTPSV